MKRIVWSLLIAIITCIQTGKATAATPGDTLDIVKRYLKNTKPLEGADLKSVPYYLREKHIMITTKGKTIEWEMYNACDRKAQKFYTRTEVPNKKRCTAMAINGDKGWVNVGGFTLRCNKRAITKEWANVDSSYHIPPVFNPELFKRELGEKRTIRQKQCTGIIFTNKADSTQKVTYYFDNATGWAICSESIGIKTDFLEYKSFGGYLICTKKHLVYSGETAERTKIKEHTITVESACVDCMLDPELFTHEAVKNAFKKKKKKE